MTTRVKSRCAMPKPATESIRISKEIARKARIIAAANGVSMPTYIEAKLSAIVESELPAVARMLGLEGPEEKPPKKK